MEQGKKKVKFGVEGSFSPISSTPVFWKSRKRSASMKNVDKIIDDADKSPPKQEESPTAETERESTPATILSEKRKALFEPLEPVSINVRRPTAESLLPPPDFDEASYPRGWLIGKKWKLINVDVVESMRRIAEQEMNRKDGEIDNLNEQLEEDSRCLEHLQIQLLEERKRAEVERQNAMLRNQITMLMDMLQDNENVDDGGSEEPYIFLLYSFVNVFWSV